MPKPTSRHIQQVRDILAEMISYLDWEIGTEVKSKSGVYVSEDSIMLAKILRDDYSCGKKKLLLALKKDGDGQQFVNALMSSSKVRNYLPSLCGRVQFADKNEVCGTLVKENEKETAMKMYDGKKIS